MNYVEHLNFYGIEAKEIPCVKGAGAPTTATVGAVGLLYMDTNTGKLYKCTSATEGEFLWVDINTEVAQETGTSTVKVMSQKAVTEKLNVIDMQISRNDKRIKNFEAGIPAEDFVTDSSTAYRRDVPTNALPFAEVTEIGGMTYKEGDVLRSAPVYEVVSEGANFLNLKDYSRTVVGIPVSINGGVVTAKGTANASGGRTNALTDTFILQAGTYNFSYIGTVGDAFPYLNKQAGGTVIAATSAGSVFTLTEPTAVYFGINFTQGVAYDISFELMLNKGTTALPNRPYIKRTLTMPETVRNLPNYGVGIPNTDYFNRIRWRYDEQADKWVREYKNRAKKIVLDGVTYPVLQVAKYVDLYTLVFAVGNTVPNTKVLAVGYESEVNNYTVGTNIFINANNYILVTLPDQTITTEAGANSYLQQHPIECIVSQTETVTDISDLLPYDNLIGVEGGGSITMQNEYGYDVPAKVTYQIEEVTV